MQKDQSAPDANPNRNEFNRALDRIAYYLAARDHSRYELTTKLSRAFTPEVIEQALAEADARNWLVDEWEMARRAAESLVRKNKSLTYIVGHIRKRKLPTEAAADLDEVDSAAQLLIRKFKSGSRDQKTREKAIRFLMYRGFRGNTIQSALAQWSQDSGSEEI